MCVRRTNGRSVREERVKEGISDRERHGKYRFYASTLTYSGGSLTSLLHVQSCRVTKQHERAEVSLWRD